MTKLEQGKTPWAVGGHYTEFEISSDQKRNNSYVPILSLLTIWYTIVCFHYFLVLSEFTI